MTPPIRTPLLSPVLTAFGLFFVFGIIVMNRLWPSGWAWEPEQPAYLHMIFSIYATLGIFLLLAARDPARYLGLIWFTVWSSLAHGTAMAWHSVADTLSAPTTTPARMQSPPLRLCWCHRSFGPAKPSGAFLPDSCA